MVVSIKYPNLFRARMLSIIETHRFIHILCSLFGANFSSFCAFFVYCCIHLRVHNIFPHFRLFHSNKNCLRYTHILFFVPNIRMYVLHAHILVDSYKCTIILLNLPQWFCKKQTLFPIVNGDKQKYAKSGKHKSKLILCKLN